MPFIKRAILKYFYQLFASVSDKIPSRVTSDTRVIVLPLLALTVFVLLAVNRKVNFP